MLALGVTLNHELVHDITDPESANEGKPGFR